MGLAKIVIGISPGIYGAIAGVWVTEQRLARPEVWVMPMPLCGDGIDYEGIKSLFHMAMDLSSSVHSPSFLLAAIDWTKPTVHCGTLLGVAMGMGIEAVRVHQSNWAGTMGKKQRIFKMQALYPDAPLDDAAVNGKAEALLIARYAAKFYVDKEAGGCAQHATTKSPTP